MYSKEEASQIRKKFWVSFGQFMQLQPSATGLRVNWINYKTGIRGIEFKTDADNRSARIAIEIRPRDDEMRPLMFEQFEEFKPYFESVVGDDWLWLQEVYSDTGQLLDKIELKLEKVSIFRETDWPEIIVFLKDNLIRLDEFWDGASEAFQIFK